MATNKKNTIYEYGINSLSDIASFARFVNYSEKLFQLDELFESVEDKKNYEQTWFELEIINALALSQWETEGRPTDWSNQWNLTYKRDAADVMSKLLHLLK